VLTGRISVRLQPWLADHVVGGQVLVPGTALLELAVRAGDAAGCAQVAELTLQAPMMLPADDALQVQVVVGGAGGGGDREVAVYSRPAGGSWTCHAQGTLIPAGPVAGAETHAAGELTVWPPPGAAAVDTGGWYEQLAEAGLGYGQAFRGLTGAWRRGDEVFAEAVLPEAAGDPARFGLHPALLDAVLYAAGLTRVGGPDGAGGMLVPFAWTGVRLHAGGAGMLRARLQVTGDGTITLAAADGTGQPVITVRALALRPVTAAQLQAASGGTEQRLFSVNWAPIPAGTVTGTWAVTGPDPYQAAAGLAAAGARVASYADLAALAAATQAGTPVPDLIVITADGAGSAREDLAAAAGTAGDGELADPGLQAVAVAVGVLGAVQEWLAGPVAGAQLVVITQDAVAAWPGDRVSGLAGAAAWGLVRSAQAEHPGRIILADLPPASDSAKVFGPLATAIGSGEPEVAIRDGQCWGRRLGRPTGNLPVQPGVRQAGTVLVTGGTGTLGGLTARHLAATGQAAACVLVSRSGPAAPGVPALTAGLASTGVPVRVLAADLTDPAQAAALVTAAKDEGRLAMVVHAAGVVDDATITTMTPGQVRTVMAAKATVAWQLHEATRDADLDGFVLFSSAASVLGGAGQGNYAAGNAFLDALAQYRHAAGFAARSLAWGLWEQDSAITAGLGQAGRARISRAGMTALTSGEGLALLDAAAARPQPLLMAARLDLARIRAQAGTLPPLWRALAGPGSRPDAGVAASGGGSGLQHQLAALPAAEQDRVLTSLVREHAAAVLGHPGPDAVEPGRAFTDLGFDSLTAVELRNRLTTATGLQLPATLTFDYPTPTAIAVYLRTTMLDEETGSTAILKELDRLGSLLSEITPDDTSYELIGDHLKGFLSKWGNVGDKPESQAVAQKIKSATDDEIFEFINKKLGRA
jgi:acyl carrier protein